MLSPLSFKWETFVIFSFDFPMFVKAWATHPIAQLILMDGFDVIHAVYLEINIKHEIKDKMLTLSFRTAYISQWYHLVSGSKQNWGSWLCSFLFFMAIISYVVLSVYCSAPFPIHIKWIPWEIIIAGPTFMWVRKQYALST